MCGYKELQVVGVSVRVLHDERGYPSARVSFSYRRLEKVARTVCLEYARERLSEKKKKKKMLRKDTKKGGGGGGGRKQNPEREGNVS